MAITIYRCTNPGDNITNVIDKMVFSDSSKKNTRQPNAFITDFIVDDNAAVGENQAPTQDLGNKQHLGTFEDLYTFIGYISDRPSDGTLINLMATWQDEPKINANFPQGRFGVQFDDFSQYSIIPVGTGTEQIGMLWQRLKWSINFRRSPPHAPFTLSFTVSKSDGS